MAEQHAEADKKRKEVIESTNSAENIIHDTEKAMSEFKDQLDKTEAGKITEKIKEVREYIAKGAEEIDGEKVKLMAGEVQQASLKLFEMVYKKRAAENSGSQNQESVDAEFKDAKDSKKE